MDHDQNTDSWMDPTGSPSTVRTNSATLGRPIRIDDDIEQVEPDTPDVRVYVNHEQEPATGSIIFLHPTPAAPLSLTPTGTTILYVLREQLSTCPPPMPPPSLVDDVEYRCYYFLLRQSFFHAMQNLKRADAEFERGRRDQPVHGTTTRHLMVSETERRSIALSIVRGLRLLQTPTGRPPRNCLLCDGPPASPRAHSEDSVATNTLEVESLKYSRFGRFSISAELDKVSILPPIREETDTPMLCGLHRYVFRYLMYQVVSPSWAVPHHEEDMARFGEIGVAVWNPGTQLWQFPEPNR